MTPNQNDRSLDGALSTEQSDHQVDTKNAISGTVSRPTLLSMFSGLHDHPPQGNATMVETSAEHGCRVNLERDNIDKPSVSKVLECELIDATLEAGAFMWSMSLSSALGDTTDNSDDEEEDDSQDDDDEIIEHVRKKIKLTVEDSKIPSCSKQNQLIVVSSDPDFDIGRTYVIDLFQDHITPHHRSTDHNMLICRPSKDDASSSSPGFDLESSTLACGFIHPTTRFDSKSNSIRSNLDKMKSCDTFIVQVTPTEIRCIDGMKGRQLIAPPINLLDLYNQPQTPDPPAPDHKQPSVPNSSPDSSPLNALSHLCSDLMDAPLAVQAIVQSPWIAVLFDDGTLRLWTVSNPTDCLNRSHYLDFPSYQSLDHINSPMKSNLMNNDQQPLTLVPRNLFLPEMRLSIFCINSCALPPNQFFDETKISDLRLVLSKSENKNHSDERIGQQGRDLSFNLRRNMGHPLSDDLIYLMIVPKERPQCVMIFCLNVFELVFSIEFKSDYPLEIRNTIHLDDQFDDSSNDSMTSLPISPITSTSAIPVIPDANPSPLSFNKTHPPIIFSVELILMDRYDMGPTLLIMIQNSPLLIYRTFTSTPDFPECHPLFPFRFQRVYKELTLTTGRPLGEILRPFYRGPITSKIKSNDLISQTSSSSSSHVGSVAVSVVPISEI